MKCLRQGNPDKLNKGVLCSAFQLFCCFKLFPKFNLLKKKTYCLHHIELKEDSRA